MPQFGYGKNGEIIHYAKYSIRGVETVSEIFPNSRKTKKLLVLKDKQHFRDVYNMSYTALAVRKIFYDFLILVFERLTTGGMLVFPGTTGANIAIKPMADSSVRRRSREGGLKFINLTKSRFKVPLFVFNFGPGSARRDRFINTPKRVWRQLLRNAEEDKIKYTYNRRSSRR